MCECVWVCVSVVSDCVCVCVCVCVCWWVVVWERELLEGVDDVGGCGCGLGVGCDIREGKCAGLRHPGTARLGCWVQGSRQKKDLGHWFGLWFFVVVGGEELGATPRLIDRWVLRVRVGREDDFACPVPPPLAVV